MTNAPGAHIDPDDRAALRAWLQAEYDHPFVGWDFAYLAGRRVDTPLPWDYAQLVRDALPHSRALLDMGTGGGELLASLHPLPSLTRATEGYAPNLPVARARLEPLGIAVAEVGEDGHLPFADGAFDLVINRHEYYDPGEVWRVLRPGGRFITQQVGGDDDRELNTLLGAPNATHEYGFWTLDYALPSLKSADFRITRADEARIPSRFTDVGAIVYYLKITPWQIPDFSVERYLAPLQQLHRRCQRHGPIIVHSHRFIIAAEKPAT
jgi:SAM-dependent methyltransferase